MLLKFIKFILWFKQYVVYDWFQPMWSVCWGLCKHGDSTWTHAELRRRFTRKQRKLITVVCAGIIFVFRQSTYK